MDFEGLEDVSLAEKGRPGGGYSIDNGSKAGK